MYSSFVLCIYVPFLFDFTITKCRHRKLGNGKLCCFSSLIIYISCITEYNIFILYFSHFFLNAFHRSLSNKAASIPKIPILKPIAQIRSPHIDCCTAATPSSSDPLKNVVVVVLLSCLLLTQPLGLKRFFLAVLPSPTPM
jgi:hypothetical protein